MFKLIHPDDCRALHTVAVAYGGALALFNQRPGLTRRRELIDAANALLRVQRDVGVDVHPGLDKFIDDLCRAQARDLDMQKLRAAAR